MGLEEFVPRALNADRLLDADTRNAMKLSEMTPEQKRIRIAELCGWTIDFDAEPEYVRYYESRTGFRQHELKSDPIPPYIPDYLNDLNAMHEAEATLTGDEWSEYTKTLDRLARAATPLLIPQWRSIHPSYVIDAFQIHARADIKADAFLLAKGVKP